MVQEKNGAIYTRPWVAEFILDLAGYVPGGNLVDTLAVEPAAGDGAFLVPMVRRLLASCRGQQRPFLDCADSLLAFDLNDASAAQARAAVGKLLRSEGISERESDLLLARWIRSGDYLLDAPTLPRANFVIGNPPTFASKT